MHTGTRLLVSVVTVQQVVSCVQSTHSLHTHTCKYGQGSLVVLPCVQIDMGLLCNSAYPSRVLCVLLWAQWWVQASSVHVYIGETYIQFHVVSYLLTLPLSPLQPYPVQSSQQPRKVSAM